MKKLYLYLPFVFLIIFAINFNSCGSYCPDCEPGMEGYNPDGQVVVQDTIKMPPVIVEEKVPYKVTVQIGAFRDRNYADAYATEARTKLDLRVEVNLDPLDGLYKVTVGTFDNVETANNYLRTVISRGYKDAFTRNKTK